MKITRILQSGAIALMLSAAYSSTVFAHGGGVLRVVSKQIPSGGSIQMSGEKLGKNASLRLELRGVLDNYPIGSVRTGADEKLSASVAIPASVPAGTYTLAAIAADGDVAGRTEVSVGPASVVEAEKSGMPHMAGRGMAGMEGMQASADMMKLDIETTGLEWAVISFLILLSFAAGAALLARSRRASEG